MLPFLKLKSVLFIVFTTLVLGSHAKFSARSSNRKATRSARFITRISKKCTLIQAKYQEPIALLDKSPSFIARALVDAANKNYWFFKFARSAKAIDNSILELECYTNNPILNRQDLAPLLTEIKQTINDLKLLSNYLKKTPEYQGEITKYLKLNRVGLFVGFIVCGLLSAEFLIGAALYACVAIYVNVAYASTAAVLLTGGLLSLTATLKCHESMKQIRKQSFPNQSKNQGFPIKSRYQPA